MPTDQAHVAAYMISLAGIAVLGIGAFIYIVVTTPKRKPRAVQRSFDFKNKEPHEPRPPELMPPMAGGV